MHVKGTLREESPRRDEDLLPPAYLAEIGKGVLLTNARIRLLEEQLAGNVNLLREETERQTSTCRKQLSEQIGKAKSELSNEVSGLGKLLSAFQRHTAESANTSRKEIVESIAACRQQVVGRIEDQGRVLIAGNREIAVALQDAKSQFDFELGAARTEIVGHVRTAHTETCNLLAFTNERLDRLTQWVFGLAAAAGVLFILLVAALIQLSQLSKG